MKKVLFLAIAFSSCALIFASVRIKTDNEQASAVVVTSYKSAMIADGKDEAVIKISVIDKKGKSIITADNLMRFKVTGDAKISSVTNGYDDAHNLGSHLRANLYGGQLTVVLRAGKNPGVLKFEALSDGLISGSTEIHTMQPGKAPLVTTGCLSRK